MTAIRAWAAAVLAGVLLAGASPALSQAPAAAEALPGRPYQLQFDVRIPMRDGAELSAIVVRPADQSGPLPVIVSLTPYVADRYVAMGAYFARHGYVFASVDVRGRGNSDGEFRPWTVDRLDGADAIEWLARQPWSDGQVAAWGGSYAGKNQWMFAGEAPPSLRTIVPSAAGIVGENIGLYAGNIHRAFNFNWLLMSSGRTSNDVIAGDDEFWMGAYAEISRGHIPHRDFDTLVGYPSAIWREWMEHPAWDEFWDSASVAPDRYAHIRMPTLSITGQYDGSNTGTLRFRQQHLDAADAETAARSYLVIGPWDHPGTRTPRRHLGGLDMGEPSVVDVRALHVAWYDHVLKGAPLPAFLRDRVVYYVTGANEWRAAPDVDSATRRRQTLYFSSPDTDAGAVARAGMLAERAPAQAPDAYVYDPSHPGYNEGFEAGDLVSPDFLTDQGLMRRLDGDGLVYDTPPLAEAADLVGIPEVELRLAMDVPDTDLRVVFYEIRADGSAAFIAQDQLRARYRHSLREETLVTPGRVETYRFRTLPFIARTLAAGSRVRVVVAPLGASIHNERNRNSGRPVADETSADNRVATVRMMLGGREASRVVLPWG